LSRQVWRKLGLVYRPHGDVPWQASHAYLPTALALPEGRIRVFVAFRDAEGRGRIGSVDVASSNPQKVVNVSEAPCLDLGRPGTFDEHGVSPLSVIWHESTLYLFYAGWQRSQTVRYHLFTGLAKSNDLGCTFERVSEAPILDRCDGELLIRSGGFAFTFRDKWILAYMGGSEMFDLMGKLTPTYDLFTITSASPIMWSGVGRKVLSPKRPVEFGFGRPWIIPQSDYCKMWLSVRSVEAGYSITYAESFDGLQWMRDDDALRFVGEQQQWDSASMSCASIVDTEKGRFMFYNGNGYGETGFGVAQLESET
jgi:hypothetical protein